MNHSTRQIQNVSKCLWISKHALIVPTFKTHPPPGSVDYTAHALCADPPAEMWVLPQCVHPCCCWHPARASWGGASPQATRVLCVPVWVPAAPVPHGGLLGLLRGDAWRCPSGVTAPPSAAPSHLPLVSSSFPGYRLIRLVVFLISTASFGESPSQAVLGVP